MTEQRYIPDSDYMESLIQNIKHSSERQANGYAHLIFSEKIEHTLENLPDECKDEFMKLAGEYGYTPSRYQTRFSETDSDDLYE